jgi:hypothetical protein
MIGDRLASLLLKGQIPDGSHVTVSAGDEEELVFTVT